MKKIFLFYFFMLGCFCVYSQTYIPTGQGVDGIFTTTGFSVDELVLTPASLNFQLPDNIDNSLLTEGYFPDVFKQEGESCLQASEIGYCLTYEMNRLRNVPAGNWDTHDANLYSPFYTYNFLNDGTGSTGTYVFSGFSLAYDNGIPMFDSYYDVALDGAARFAYWMTGYDKYYNGKKNSISDVSKVTFTTDYNCLFNLKHWLADHNEGQGAIGGVATICVYNHNEILVPLPNSNEYIITQLSLTNSGMGHALTVVGYDENIGFDFNGDGQITTTLDINNDQVVNLLDRELGALCVVNSLENWGNDQNIILPRFRTHQS